MTTTPDRPTLDGLELKWDEVWESDQTYAFDRSAERSDVFSIDTPPPTVSGSLHMGSAFGYVQTDCLARYRRMRGKTLFYPMGWDDNGLPTERRVQNYYGVRCDPSLPHDPSFVPPDKPGKDPVSVGRRTFVELCLRLTAEDEKVFEQLWRRLGLSVDWTQTYTTIGPVSQRASQRAFLRNLARGEAYAQEAPTLWDVDFRTAVAQAELVDKPTPGAYHRLAFTRVDSTRPDGEKVFIETTRPELLPACVALVAHPDDPRYQPLFGTTVTTPLFGVEVPVKAHHLADPEKGSGIAMICTFGDTTDVIWWRELDLPVRSTIGRDGRILPTPPEGVAGPYAELAGKTVKQAQRRIVELLAESGDLVGEPRAIEHPVKYYEKGDRPLEVVTSRQWYLRNGGRDADLRAELLDRGDQLAWHPSHMQTRYDNWVDGLNGDWLISRQRFFGVPVPLWYPLDEAGEPRYDAPLVPEESVLPVDPSSDAPAGYREDQRGVPGGFTGDADVMDTWATSSLSPQIAGRWEDDPDLFGRVFPMDLRPQGPEIIRTWLFSTVVRSHLEHGVLPWADTSINGWILDPDRKKMSKSQGNVVTPMPLIEEHGADAVRYWACSGRPGVDTAIDYAQMKVGRRLAVKLLNATKFVLGFPAAEGEVTPTVTEPVDLAMLAGLADLVAESTEAFEAYDYARALERTEARFWSFCDDYIELVKARAYTEGPAAASAGAALRIALATLQKLLAPFQPFAAEEVWSWWQEGSVHRSGWPELDRGTGDPALLTAAAEVLTAVRRAKSSAKVSMRAEVAQVVVRGDAARLALVEQARADLVGAGVITGELVLEQGPDGVEVMLAPVPEQAA